MRLTQIFRCRVRVWRYINGENSFDLAPGLIVDGAIGAHRLGVPGLTIPARGKGRLRALTFEQQHTAVLSRNHLEDSLQQLLRDAFRPADQPKVGASLKESAATFAMTIPQVARRPEP